MGVDGDCVAVTDARCQVRGIDGLSVIDGSCCRRFPAADPRDHGDAGARAAEFLIAD